MYHNLVLDFIIELVPVLGDIVDALFHVQYSKYIYARNYLREDDNKTHRIGLGSNPALDSSYPANMVAAEGGGWVRTIHHELNKFGQSYLYGYKSFIEHNGLTTMDRQH